ncbi:MAG: hypothetical protein KJ600_06920 [Nanoarchaeota archaeon]|nr:hypothetical protein [Nanoarchaeota archaeon]MBU1104256.1 hypothetical protein [Nanoarchaeota archaeon]
MSRRLWQGLAGLLIVSASLISGGATYICVRDYLYQSDIYGEPSYRGQLEESVPAVAGLLTGLATLTAGSALFVYFDEKRG